MLLIHLYVTAVHDVNTDNPRSVRHVHIFFPAGNLIISQYHRLDTFFCPFSGCANVSNGSRYNLSRTLVGHYVFLLYTVLKVKLKLIGQWRLLESEPGFMAIRPPPLSSSFVPLLRSPDQCLSKRIIT